MASKRTINRMYWAAVKAVANGDEVLSAPYVYRKALSGRPDRLILPYLESLEDKYGPARLKDVSREELWPARQIVDAIRDQIG